MRPTLVLDVVGLTPSLLGRYTPNLNRLAERGGRRALKTVTPAVTCTVQTTMLTGLAPRDHGIVANGWYFRDLAEVWFWRQSNRLVAGERVWDAARRIDPGFTCANLFWWYNMYSGADIGVTPRPMYPADGRKIPDCYAEPPELRDELTGLLGRFPLFQFWGPATDIASSAWIARAARHVMATRKPTLTLVYLPHLDYCLQRLGPRHPQVVKDLAEVDRLCGELIAEADAVGGAVIALSEYAVAPVRRPVHVNRALREAGLIRVREELGRELLDPGASAAFAVADHQVAHVYVRDPARIGEVARLIEALPGVERVLDEDGKRAFGLDHPRSGELVALAEPDAWFTYYYWLDDARAPDFARMVEIHRKPGYDPVELFLDPALRWPKGAVGWRLLKRALGLRTLLDVIPLDATLVRGSHGRPTDDPEEGPVILSSEPGLLPDRPVAAAEVKDLMLAHVFGKAAVPVG
ncbi:alkaline phosphatase family protein [Arenibaculum sp.]|uniref:nucleotide pyrophosphatase/phosphodiesterase family protein n=1 Tax=Arenibaculum sp. TaxID=2865862 RepID=UPI002E0EBAD3|nr:nucleotide pyrophosphatase/phosphodiesterase family protein [Arenibaculum sp.]